MMLLLVVVVVCEHVQVGDVAMQLYSEHPQSVSNAIYTQRGI